MVALIVDELFNNKPQTDPESAVQIRSILPEDLRCQVYISLRSSFLS